MKRIIAILILLIATGAIGYTPPTDRSPAVIGPPDAVARMTVTQLAGAPPLVAGGAVETTGTPTSSNAATTGATTYDVSITVPADANTICVVLGTYGLSADVLNFDDGGDVDFVNASDTNPYHGGGGSNFRVYGLYMTSASAAWPGTGAKTLKWSLSDNAAYGPFLYVFYLKGVDTDAPIVDSHIDSGTADWTASLSGVGANDLAIVTKTTYQQAIDADPDGSGQTAILESDQVANMRLGIGKELGENSPRIVNGGTGYPGNIAFAFKAD